MLARVGRSLWMAKESRLCCPPFGGLRDARAISSFIVDMFFGAGMMRSFRAPLTAGHNRASRDFLERNKMKSCSIARNVEMPSDSSEP